jgi:hypothetical protein
MPNLPVKYRKSPEAIASYSYTDIERGTGVAIFYGIRDFNSGSLRLIENTVEAGTTMTSNITVSGFSDWNDDGVMQFDTEEFASKRVLKGNPYVVIPVGGGEDDGVTINDLKLVHVHGAGGTTDLTTEIDLAEIVDSAGSMQMALFIELGEVSSTTIEKGDKLRIYMDTSIDGGAFIYHNPSGSSINYGGVNASRTQLSVGIPFRINI